MTTTPPSSPPSAAVSAAAENRGTGNGGAAASVAAAAAPPPPTTAASTSTATGVWVGIDFGHTHCCAAVYDSVRGRPKWMRLRGVASSSSSKPGRLVPTALLFVLLAVPPPGCPPPRGRRRRGRPDDDGGGGGGDGRLGGCSGWVRVRDYVDVVAGTPPDNRRLPRKEEGVVVGEELYALVGAPALGVLERASASAASSGGRQRRKQQKLERKIEAALVTNFKRRIGRYRYDGNTGDDGDKDKINNNDGGEQLLLRVTPLRGMPRTDDDDGTDDDDEEDEDEQDNDISIKISPLDCATLCLAAVRESCESYLRREVPRKNLQVPFRGSYSGPIHAVLGVPAQWSRRTRSRFARAAAARAGFFSPGGGGGTAVRATTTITESTAAALSYGLFVSPTSSSTAAAISASGKISSDSTAAAAASSKSESAKPPSESSLDGSNKRESKKSDKLVLVYDMGGGTTDVTVVVLKQRQQRQRQQSESESESGTPEIFQVLASRGAVLGGEDFDRALFDVVCRKLARPPSSTTSSSEAWQRSTLRRCRAAKEELCGTDETTKRSSVRIVVERNGGDGRSGGTAVEDVVVEITMAEFEQAAQPLLERAQRLIQHALRAATTAYRSAGVAEAGGDGTAASKLLTMDEVVLVGGSTFVPAVQDTLRRTFNIELCRSVHPMSAVAVGTAIQAAIDSKLVPLHSLKAAMMLDALPYAIGVLTTPDGATSERHHFIEVLSKDASLPATGSAQFQLARVEQAGVTVQVVELVDDIDDGVVSGDKIHYEPVHTFNFLLHRLPIKELEVMSTRSVEIEITMKQTGELVVSIFDNLDPEQAAIRRRRGNSTVTEVRSNNQLGYEPGGGAGVLPKEQQALVVLLVVLVFLYVAAKMAFNDIE